MNVDQLEAKWEEIKGQVKTKWGKLTNEDLTAIHGKKDQLIAKLRERYEYPADRAERELVSFMKDCSCESAAKATAQTQNSAVNSVEL